MSESYTGPAEISSEELGVWRTAVELWVEEPGEWRGTCLVDEELLGQLDGMAVTIRLKTGRTGTALVDGEELAGTGPAPFL